MGRDGCGGKLDMSLDDIVSAGYGKAAGRGRERERSSPYGNDSTSGNRRVFVGNLAYSVSWQELKDHMRAAGQVLHCDIIAEPGTALGSKGCGLVEFATPSAAQKAIEELTETKLNGRPIYVREDRDTGKPIAVAAHRARGGYDTGGSGSRDSRDSGGMAVFVGNLPYSVTWQDLKDHMRSAGDVVHCDIIPEPGTKLGSKGCGLVRYATPGGARRAIRDLSETYLKGRSIYVREDREEDK
mmetsp:Transcript_108755/g.307599  ORF Transcript_108755/g.307599 Transcript_108755/m.307599 type:complete len:241 (+) Transcript_108755:47-769(+)